MIVPYLIYGAVKALVSREMRIQLRHSELQLGQNCEQFLTLSDRPIKCCDASALSFLEVKSGPL
jgi:hypothetical protein